MGRDFRYAIRALTRTPSFVVVAASLIALGVAACTVVFSIVNAVYFRPLPYRDASLLVMAQQVTPGHACVNGCSIPIPPSDLPQWSDHLGPVADVAYGVEYWGVLSTRFETTYGVGAAVSGNFFSLLGLRPALGRGLTADDDRASAQLVMVLSHAFWQDAFHGDSTVIGSSVSLDNRTYRVVGVAARDLPVGRPILDVDDPAISPGVPFFIALASSEVGAHDRPPAEARVVGRLGAGYSSAQLQSRVSTLLRPPARPTVHSLRYLFAREYTASYPLFLGAVILVLAVACGNLAGLFVARFSARRREIAIRMALGAPRARVWRELLAEGVCVSMAGGAIGVALSVWGIRLAYALPARDIPYWTRFTIDARVLVFALAASALSALAASVWPAIIATNGGAHVLTRTDLSSGLTRSAMTTRRHILCAQMACTLVLLTCAGLLGKSFLRAASRNTGLAEGQLVTGLVDLTKRHGNQATDQRVTAFELLQRLSGLPGVQGVAGRGAASDPDAEGMTREGDRAMLSGSAVPTSAEVISAGYFRTVTTLPIRGREFSTVDGPLAPPVAILSDSTARSLFPRENAIGRRIRFGPPSSPSPWMTIVGIAGEPAPDGALSAIRHYNPVLYRPLAQVGTTHLRIFVRTAGPSASLVSAVRSVVRSSLPTAPVVGVTSMTAVRERRLSPLRTNAVVFGAFAIMSLVIAAVGLYGVVSYLVHESTTEIGIRMALGAARRRVLVEHLRSALVIVGAGVALGLAGAYVATQVLQSMLYDTSPSDPQVFAGAAALMALVTLAATIIPAQRATKIDPARALRGE